jgi:hypothetical protein
VPYPGLVRELTDIPTCPADMSNFHDECEAPGERALFDEITKTTVTFQSKQNPAGVKVSQRDFHAKQNACLAGTWIPLKRVAKPYRAGVFGLPGPIKAVIRYSNGAPKSVAGNDQLAPDTHPEPRGLAIKLVDVPGESILNVEGAGSGRTTQDFVMINFPQFFLRTPKSYPEFMTAITSGKPFFQLLDPLERKVLIASNTIVADEVAETFFSQVPYVVGSAYGKYRVRLCEKEASVHLTPEQAKNLGPNFLRERISKRISSKPICLIFSVQLKSPQMNVEDAAVEWKPSEGASFVDVAKIMIPKGQDINDPERDSYCENLSFNPWNSLPENRPAGAISRARRSVYSALSRKRRMENTVVVREPKGDETFFDLLK